MKKHSAIITSYGNEVTSTFSMAGHPDHTTQQQILLDYRNGEQTGFSAVFKYLYRPLYLYAINKVERPEQAEDVVQDAFIKVWKHRAQFEHWLSLQHYFYTTVRNLSIEWLRKQQALKALHLASIPIADTESSHVNNIIRVETWSELYQAISELPTQSQTVLRLLYMEGFNTRQVATKMGIDISVVRKHQKKGLRILRSKVKPLVYLSFIMSLHSL